MTQEQVAKHDDFDWGLENIARDPNIIAQYEQTLKSQFQLGELYQGSILSDKGQYYIFSNGGKSDVFISKDDCIHEYADGDQVIVKITSTPSKHNKDYVGSLREATEQMRFNILYDSIGNENVAYEVTVKELIPNAGYLVDIDGFEAFLPGSKASINRLSNPESIVGTKLMVFIISYTQKTDTLIVSHKKYIQTQIPDVLDSVEVGEWYDGRITGFSKFGVFVEFKDILTGMIHNSDLDEETQQNLKSKSLKFGDPIHFKIKSIYNNRIALSQNNGIDIWDNIKLKYQYNRKYSGTVALKTRWGYLIELEDGIRGACRTPHEMKLNEGDSVNIIINKIDKNRRKIYLTVI